MEKLKNLKFDDKGLIPTIIQENTTGEVLMMAYMNRESLEKTMETGETWFYSRSRKELWHKGETSGNIQSVKEITYDCDGDALLIKVEQQGVACHTGEKNCFFNTILGSLEEQKPKAEVLEKLYKVISNRKENPKPESYTNYLFDNGIDKILKKVGEEASEVIIAAKNNDKDELVYETGDLIYHLMVLLKQQEIEPEDIYQELSLRFK